MTRSAGKAAFIILLAALGLSACALLSVFGPSHLPGVSIAKVETVRAPWGYWRSTARFGGDDRREEELLVLTLSSQRSLRDFSRRYDYTIHNLAAFCRAGEPDETLRLRHDPYVYDSKGEYVDFRRAPEPPDPTYRIFIAVRSILRAQRDTYQYDLRRTPEDVCIRIRGGNMVGGSYKSDVLVIPAASVTAALAAGQR
jgi:hypothetical protein